MYNSIIKYTKRFLVWGVLSVVLFKMVGIFLAIFMLQIYSNHYNTLNIYNSNKEFFKEAVQKLTQESSDLGNYTEIRCAYSKEEKIPYYCEYNFSPSDEFEGAMKEVGILSIKKEIYLQEKNVLLSFQLDKSSYPFNQTAYPVIRYTKNGYNGDYSRMLPYPISNRYIYIGSLVYAIDEHWTIIWDDPMIGG